MRGLRPRFNLDWSRGSPSFAGSAAHTTQFLDDGWPPMAVEYSVARPVRAEIQRECAGRPGRDCQAIRTPGGCAHSSTAAAQAMSGATRGAPMRGSNPFPKEETLTIIETRPRQVRIPAIVRAVCIRPDPKDWKAKPRPDEIDAVMDRLPPDTVELVDIDYECRLPRLSRQRQVRYINLGARKLRDYSPLFTLTRLEHVFLISAPLTSLSAFQNRPLKSVRLIRGHVAHVDVSAAFVFLQNCTQLTAFGNVSIVNLILQSCRRMHLASLASLRGLRQLRLLAPGPLSSAAPLLGCKSLESLVITATPLGKTDLRVLGAMPSLKWVFLGVGAARVAELAEILPRVMITNGDVCFRATKQLSPQQYYREVEAADFASWR